MNSRWDISYLAVMVDMAGCPNRCRHYWLGAHKDGNMTVKDFHDMRYGGTSSGSFTAKAT